MTNTLEKLDGEVWRLHIIGVYVSNLGRVYLPKSGTHQAHYTYGSLKSCGYLYIGYKGKYYRVHRLVAECFLDNPNNYKEIDHINRIKTDNRVSNLRWADRSMQMKNSYHPKNIVSSKKVLMIDKDTNEIIKVWESTMECQRNGFHSGNISSCCRGKHKQHKGYVWRYA